jgi:hypothetical protein
MANTQFSFYTKTKPKYNYQIEIMPAASLFFCILSNNMNILLESVQNLLNYMLHHNISRPYTRRPHDPQGYTRRQKPTIYDNTTR